MIDVQHINIFEIDEALKIFDRNQKAIICFTDVDEDLNVYVVREDNKFHVYGITVSDQHCIDGWMFDTLSESYNKIKSYFNFESIKT